MKTKSIILSLSIVLFSTFSVSGAFLRNVPQQLKQPDGTVLNCFATGDEFHNWLHDENNFTIIQHPESGYYVYVEVVNERLSPSQWKVGSVNPASIGLAPGLNISKEEYLEKRRRKTHYPGFKSLKTGPNVGTMQNLVVFIRFQNQAEYNENSSYYNNAFNGTNMVSMNAYYDVVSNNQLEINSHFFPESNSTTVVSFQDSHHRSYYQPYNAATNPGGYRNDNEYATREHTLLKDATAYVQAEIEGKNLNLDMNGDGKVDNIVYIIQGRTDGWSDLLWPHKWALYSHNVYLDGVQVWWYNFQLSEAFNVSVLCHEMFHSLGAPDLYRYEDRNLTPVGPWDLMAETTTPPQHMGVYMKMKYGGWINSIPSISAGGTYTLESLSDNPYAAYKIASPNSTSEYFVLEYRNKTGQYESSLPGSGLIIYRIKPSVDGNAEGPPDEVYVYRPNGTTNVNGDIYNAYFSQQANSTRFDDNTNPSCFLSNGAQGGIEIRNIGTAGTTISFDVVMEGGFQAPRNLTASVSGSNVGLNWQKPIEGNGTLTGYKVFRNNNQITEINNPQTTSYNDNSLATGQYNYFVKATYSAPTGESAASNIATANIGGTTGEADLLIQNPTISSNELETGSNFDISCVYKNIGTKAAGASILRLFFSRDQILDGADIHFAYGEMDALNPDEGLDIIGEGLTVPEELASGSWYVLYVADADQNVSESNENNNISYIGITIISDDFNPPQNLNASVDQNAVILFWEAPQTGTASLSGFKVYRNDQLINAINDPGALEYTDTGLAQGSYKYFVTAVYSSPSGESPASNSVDVSITSASLPDFTIINQSVSPNEVDPGDLVTIACYMVNNGTAMAGESTLRVFLSMDLTVDGQDIEIAFGGFGELEAGYYYDVFGEDILIPEDVPAGVWQVLFVADADKEVSESIENNNVAAAEISIGSDVFNPPRNLSASVSGNNVVLSWQIPEPGNGSLSAFGIYRNGAKIDQIDNALTNTYSDTGLDQGTYTYFVSAIYDSPSGESDPSNNVSVEITSSGDPDLLITDAMADPLLIAPGGMVSVYCILHNLGLSTADETMIRLYVSKDEIADNQDAELANGIMSSIDPGGYIEVSGDDLLLPISISSGLWNLIFVADADGDVAESNENNNTAIIPIGVGESTFNPPENLQAVLSGNSIELSWNAPQDGMATLAAYNIYRNGLFLNTISESANRQYVDSNLDFTTYSYIVTALYENPVGESGPSNEVIINISTDNRPDLIIKNAVVFPTNLDPGGIVSVSCDVYNTGGSQAGNSQLRLYISKNDVLDHSDLSLAYGSIDPLDPASGIYITGEDLYIPENLDSGDWFVLFVADADKEVNESIEDNNIVTVPISVASKKPDLVITDIYLPRNYANPGEMIRSTTFIFNSGLGVTATTKVSFHLSKDNILDDGDLYLNDISIKRMHGKEQIFKNNYVLIPENTIRKAYFLIAYADVSQLVVETDETNNTLAVPIIVGSSGINNESLNGSFKVFPTLADNQLFLQYDGMEMGQSQLRIYDQLGRVLYSDEIEIDGFWNDHLDISNWQKGFYYVKFTGMDKQYISNFIKN